MKNLKIYLAALILGSIAWALLTITPATAADPGYQTRLVSIYPCSAQYSPVMVLGRHIKDDGTWSNWSLVRVLDRWENPNYPCAPGHTPVPSIYTETRRIVLHKPCSRVVKWQRSPLGFDRWKTYRKVVHWHKCRR